VAAKKATPAKKAVAAKKATPAKKTAGTGTRAAAAKGASKNKPVTTKKAGSGKTAAKKAGTAGKQVKKSTTTTKKTAPAKKTAAAKTDNKAKKTAAKPAVKKKTTTKKRAGTGAAAAKSPAKKKAPLTKKAAAKTTAEKTKVTAAATAAKARAKSGRKSAAGTTADTPPAEKVIEQVIAEEPKKRRYTRRSKKNVPLPVPKYQGKLGSLTRKKVDVAAAAGPKKKASYSKKDLDYFRELILDKIQDANEELLSIEERLQDGSSGEYNEDSTYSLHMADQGTDAMEREKAYLFAARERKFISHLTDALQRIKSGNYGICIVCSNLIEKGRLEAVPHARMCVKCKQETKVK
jgi:RNA polymerase-binding transcription factor DksA